MTAERGARLGAAAQREARGAVGLRVLSQALLLGGLALTRPGWARHLRTAAVRSGSPSRPSWGAAVLLTAASALLALRGSARGGAPFPKGAAASDRPAPPPVRSVAAATASAERDLPTDGATVRDLLVDHIDLLVARRHRSGRADTEAGDDVLAALASTGVGSAPPTPQRRLLVSQVLALQDTAARLGALDDDELRALLCTAVDGLLALDREVDRR